MPLQNPQDVAAHNALTTGVHGVVGYPVAAGVCRGDYVGDDTDDRVVNHTLGVVPRVVFVMRFDSSDVAWVNRVQVLSPISDVAQAVTAWTTTTFRVSKTNVNVNNNLLDYSFVAIA